MRSKERLLVLVLAAVCLAESVCLADASALFRQAQQYEKAGNYAQAEAIYEAIVAADANTPEAFTAQEKLACLYVIWGRQAEADVAYQQLLAGYSSRAGITKAVDHVADAYRQKGNYTEARDMYRYIVTNWPAADHAVDAQKGVAISSILLGDETGAQTAVDKLFADFSGSEDISEVASEIAIAYHKLEKHRKARDICQRIIAGQKGAAQTIGTQEALVSANILLEDYAAAQAAKDRLVADFSQRSDFPGALYRVARLYQRERRYREARDTYRQIAQLPSGSRYVGKARMCAAETDIAVLLDSGSNAAARAVADKVISDFKDYSFDDSEDYPEVLNGLAIRFQKAGIYDKAAELCQRLIQQHANSRYAGKAQVDIAGINICSLISNGNDVEAEAKIQKMQSDFSGNRRLPEALYIIAKRYCLEAKRLEDQGLVEQSKAFLGKGAAIWETVGSDFPKDTYTPEACCYAGDTYFKLAKYAKSLACFQRVLDHHSTYSFAWHAQFMVGRNYESMKESGAISKSEANPKIKAAYEQLVNKYPTCPPVEYAKNWLNSYNPE